MYKSFVEEVSVKLIPLKECLPYVEILKKADHWTVTPTNLATMRVCDCPLGALQTLSFRTQSFDPHLFGVK
jgi:hypothetical protein